MTGWGWSSQHLDSLCCLCSVYVFGSGGVCWVQPDFLFHCLCQLLRPVLQKIHDYSFCIFRPRLNPRHEFSDGNDGTLGKQTIHNVQLVIWSQLQSGILTESLQIIVAGVISVWPPKVFKSCRMHIDKPRYFLDPLDHCRMTNTVRVFLLALLPVRNIQVVLWPGIFFWMLQVFLEIEI